MPRVLPRNGLNSHDLLAGVIPLHRHVYYVRKAIDETINDDNFLHDDDELFIDVVANEQYALDYTLKFNSPLAPDFAVSWSVPAGTDFLWRSIQIEPDGIIREGHGNENSISIYIGHDLNDRIATAQAVVNVGATSGRIQLRWSQNTATPVNTIVRAGSTLFALRR